MNRHPLFIVSSVLALSLVSCSSKPGHSYTFRHENIQAESLIAAGQYKDAAVLYQNLAQSKPAEAAELNLRAAEAYIKSGDMDTARSILDQLETGRIQGSEKNLLLLVQAQAALSNGQAEQALVLMNQIDGAALTQNQQIDYYQAKAFAYSLTDNLLSSAESRIALNSLYRDQDKIAENNQIIFNKLKLLPEHVLRNNPYAPPSILGGWVALTQILTLDQRQRTQEDFYLILQDWLKQFPQHPARFGFLQAQLQKPKTVFKAPSSIALLIPETGRYANAGLAIKAGFMAAYNHSLAQRKPELKIYDSAGSDVKSLYESVKQTADLIIGPLDKEKIEQLATGTELTHPVIALNHVEKLQAPNLYQFGLSPIDDVLALVQKASADGRHTALMLTPQTTQGERIGRYFDEFWQDNDHTLLEAQTYALNINDYSQPITTLLNLDESKQRHRQLEQATGQSLEFTERRRQDADAIFINAFPQGGRSLYPQLRFYRATKLPVYATSQIYTGLPDSKADNDLNSIIFCDIPWVFPELYAGALSQSALQPVWQSLPNHFLRLVALGIDAYEIVQQFEHLKERDYPGATGLLSLDAENRITRKLVCAQFENGLARLTPEYRPLQPESFDYESVPEVENVSPSDVLTE